MTEAEKKAAAIKEAEREQEIIDNLKKSSKLQVQARKDLDAEIEKGKLAISELIKTIPVHHQGEARVIEMKVNKLLAELRSGADVEDITKKLKALK